VRRFLLALVPGLLVAFACTFPDVAFVTRSAPDAADDGAPDAGDDRAPDEREVDGGDIVALDATLNEASTRADGQAVVDAGACAAKTRCDCDEDGYARLDCEVDPTTIARPGGGTLLRGDCDDLDPIRNPAADFMKLTPVGHAGDWNCRDGVERTIRTGFSCAGTGLTGCSRPGFKGTPACGSTAIYYTCVANGVLACAENDEGPRDVYCR